MAAAQPNFPILSGHLIGAANEVALLPNLPVFNMGQQLQQIQAQLQQIQANQQQMQANQQQMQANQQQTIQQLAQMQQDQRLLPMRLVNSSAGLNAPLLLPPGVAVPGVAAGALTKQVLLTYTAQNCTVLSGALGLPALPAGATVAQRRQQISDFIGAGLAC